MGDPSLLDQSTLNSDIKTIVSYGGAHGDEFAGFRFDNSRPPSRLQVAFTAHVAEHAEALRAGVAHPDRVDVVQASHTSAELEAIETAIAADLGEGRVLSVGMGWQFVEVALAPGREELAESYITRWGDAVRVSVGAVAYVPEGCGASPVAPLCGDLRGENPAVAGIELALVVDTPSITASERGRAQLVVRNIGAHRFAIDSGVPIEGVLVTPGSDHIVGRLTGGMDGVGGGVNLAPGETGTIAVVFGAARCDGQPGSALPPGAYALRVALTEEGLPDPSRPVYVSPEAPVTVT